MLARSLKHSELRRTFFSSLSTGKTDRSRQPSLLPHVHRADSSPCRGEAESSAGCGAISWRRRGHIVVVSPCMCLSQQQVSCEAGTSRENMEAGLLMMTTPSESVHELRSGENAPIAAAEIPACSEVRRKAHCACHNDSARKLRIRANSVTAPPANPAEQASGLCSSQCNGLLSLSGPN